MKKISRASSLHDERFLPFEGAGAVSSCPLTLPTDLRGFDHLSISDAVLHIRGRATVDCDLPRVSLHALRHRHASQLIAAGMDVLTISRRLGHGSPTITLGVYGHLFTNTDDRAAQIL